MCGPVSMKTPFSRKTSAAWRIASRLSSAKVTWWKRPGTAESNVEALDWGDAANEVLTAQAEGVLHAAGRL